MASSLLFFFIGNGRSLYSCSEKAEFHNFLRINNCDPCLKLLTVCTCWESQREGWIHCTKNVSKHKKCCIFIPFDRYQWGVVGKLLPPVVSSAAFCLNQQGIVYFTFHLQSPLFLSCIVEIGKLTSWWDTGKINRKATAGEARQTTRLVISSVCTWPREMAPWDLLVISPRFLPSAYWWQVIYT